MTENKIYGTPYDDAFKTMLEKFPQLIIPIINEQFGKNYELDESVEFFYKEIHKAYSGKVEADSVFRICTEIYHVEFQSNPDSTIAVRIWEYDVFISLRNPRRNADGIYELRFPHDLHSKNRANLCISQANEIHCEDGFIYRKAG